MHNKTRGLIPWFVTLVFLSLTVVLVTGYSLLSNHFYHKGMQSMTAMNMEEIGRSYIESVPPEKRNQLNTFSGYQIAGKWEQMPPAIRESFALTSSDRTFMIKRERSSWFMPPDALIFMLRYEDSNETLFVGRRRYRPPAPSLLGKNAKVIRS